MVNIADYRLPVLGPSRVMWKVLLVLFIICHAPSISGAYTWVCELSYPRVIVAPSKSTSPGGGRLRHLLRGPAGKNDAILLPGGSIERHRARFSSEYVSSNTTSSNLFDPNNGVMTNNVPDPFNFEEANIGGNGDLGEPTVYVDVRLCGCASSVLQIVDEFYCPAAASYCSPWISHEQHGVRCIEYKNWSVAWSRNSWYYILFLFAVLTGFLFCSRPGRDAIKYPISRCFPKMNTWIAETLLQAEIQSRNCIIAQYEHAIRMKRRTEGWISGYSIKTKRHACSDIATTSRPSKDEIPQDWCDSNCFDSMCTICLLEVGDGDRVADLSCGHIFHPDCLGEWILKKNSCPLCQNRDIAKEIRSFDTNDGANNQESRTEFTMLSRWRREACDIFVDFATGRSRRRLRTLTSR